MEFRKRKSSFAGCVERVAKESLKIYGKYKHSEGEFLLTIIRILRI